MNWQMMFALLMNLENLEMMTKEKGLRRPYALHALLALLMLALAACAPAPVKNCLRENASTIILGLSMFINSNGCPWRARMVNARHEWRKLPTANQLCLRPTSPFRRRLWQLRPWRCWSIWILPRWRPRSSVQSQRNFFEKPVQIVVAAIAVVNHTRMVGPPITGGSRIFCGRWNFR